MVRSAWAVVFAVLLDTFVGRYQFPNFRPIRRPLDGYLGVCGRVEANGQQPELPSENAAAVGIGAVRMCASGGWANGALAEADGGVVFCGCGGWD